jgi:VanZ family protein
MPKLKSLKPFIPAYLFASLILIGSSIPTYKLHRLQRKHLILRILFSDIVMHFVAFVILTVLLSIGYVKISQSKSWWIKAAGGSFFVGCLVEAIQLFLPYRSFSVSDLSIDLIAIIVALVVFAVVHSTTGPADKKV